MDKSDPKAVTHTAKEALIQSARADSEGFWLGRKYEKRRNTGCISRFSYCAARAKDPLFSRRRLNQSFLKLFFMILLVCVIAEKILPPSGKFALLDAGLGVFYGLLLPPAFLAVITYFTFHPMTFSSKEEKKPYTIMKAVVMGITILWAGIGIWNGKNIVLDCVQGPDTICLEDVSCSLENGYYRNGGPNCYLYGADSTGEPFRFEIADTEAQWVSGLDSVYVTYYPHTKRVLKIQEVGEQENA